MHRDRPHFSDEPVDLVLTARGVRAATKGVPVDPLHIPHFPTTDGAGAFGERAVKFAGGAEEKIGVADVAKQQAPSAEIPQGLAAGPLVGDLVPVSKHPV